MLTCAHTSHLRVCLFFIFRLLDCCHDNTSYSIIGMWNIRPYVCTCVIVCTLIWAVCLWVFVNIMQMRVIISFYWTELNLLYWESFVMSLKVLSHGKTCFTGYQMSVSCWFLIILALQLIHNCVYCFVLMWEYQEIPGLFSKLKRKPWL